MFRTFKNNPVRAWLWLFLAVNLAFPIRSETNVNSRYALLCALVEDHSVRIDNYRGMTRDWAQTPDGHSYSNKPPGPALLALPLMAIWDLLTTASLPRREDRDARREKTKTLILGILSLLLQTIPYALLVAYFVTRLGAIGVSPLALHGCALTMLFGNTAALFMNTFFGHGLAAVACLATAAAILERRWALSGWLMGFALLCDYGAVAVLPAFAFAIGFRVDANARARAKALLTTAAGALPMALIWVAYHTYCFGSPFSLPAKFQNPEFVDVAASSHNLWGVLLPFPRPEPLLWLLVGPSRGILWTQGWILLTAGLVVFGFVQKTRAETQGKTTVEMWIGVLSRFGLIGLGGLLWMNAAFGGWHGGNTPGPRYLCLILPVFGPLAALLYDGMKPAIRATYWVFTALSVGLALLYFAANSLPPVVPLWPYYLRRLVSPPSPALRFILLLLAFAVALRSTVRARPTGYRTPDML